MTTISLSRTTRLADGISLYPVRSKFLASVNEQLKVGALAPRDDRVSYLVYCFLDNFYVYRMMRGPEWGDELVKNLAVIVAQTLQGDAHFVPYEGVIVAVADGSKIEGSIKDALVAVRKGLLLLLENDLVSKQCLWLRMGYYPFLAGDRSAEHALYEAQSVCETMAGRRDVFMKEATENFVRQNGLRKYVVNYLDEALHEDWITAYFQPIVRAETGEICDVEVLARWFDPSQEFGSGANSNAVYPDQFVPVLEKARLAYLLDLKILNDACRSAHKRMEQGLDPIPFSVNLSRRDLELREGDDRFAIVGKVTRIIDKWYVPRKLVSVEITESAMSEKADLKEIINRFHGEGIEVWLDDFGKGESSLSTLKDFDFDLIKVDMAFMQGYGSGDHARDERTETVLRSIASLAHELGFKTLVEGVETQAQCDFLREAGFGRFQGWLFSAAAPTYGGIEGKGCDKERAFETLDQREARDAKPR